MHNRHAHVPPSSVDAAAPVLGLPVPPKPPGECIVYAGALRKGYGHAWANGKSQTAHRVAWEKAHGPIPRGMCLDHLCRNRACVNVNHLDLVTNRVNLLRGVGLAAINARKTTCRNGHDLSGENLAERLDRRGRICKICKSVRDKKSSAKARARARGERSTGGGA